jgi:hypothetical protein
VNCKRWLGLLLALVAGPSFAACYQFGHAVSGVSKVYSTPGDNLQGMIADCNAGGGACVPACVNYSTGMTYASPWTSFGGTCKDGGGGTHALSLTATFSSSGACPACPTANGTAFLGGSGTAPGLSCYQGCLYSTPQPTSAIHCTTGGTCTSGATEYGATSMGTACGDTNPNPSVDASGVTGSGGLTCNGAAFCVSDAKSATGCDASGTICQTGANCGTFNGDQVCVGTIAPGTCVSYSSGGVACVSTPGHTAPVPSTSGTPDTALATENGPGGPEVDYFSQGQVAASGTVVTTSAPTGGLPLGSQTLPGSAVSSGPISVSPNAGNGDCGASANAADCAAKGAGTGLPDTSTSLTYEGITNSFRSAVAGSPTGLLVTDIESAWPSGSCSLSPVSLGTLPGHSLDYGTPFCSMVTTLTTPLAAIMLACFAVLGVLIILSA